MSTKAISKSLEFWAKACPEANAGVEALAGLKELEAIRRAARALSEAGWLDVIMEEFGGTKSEVDAARLLKAIARETP